ncbi:MAG: hypothetical protein JWM96_117, partial [Alphaproteobacteria bacterium]|nr:hypothetical protein [Alphaproteobacteria bacterium]
QDNLSLDNLVKDEWPVYKLPDENMKLASF